MGCECLLRLCFVVITYGPYHSKYLHNVTTYKKQCQWPISDVNLANKIEWIMTSQTQNWLCIDSITTRYVDGTHIHSLFSWPSHLNWVKVEILPSCFDEEGEERGAIGVKYVEDIIRGMVGGGFKELSPWLQLAVADVLGYINEPGYFLWAEIV